MRALAIIVFVAAVAVTSIGVTSRASYAVDEITGTARVVHTNMILVEGTPVRLYAIDVLEREQTCDNGLVTYPCGQVAAGRLANALVNQRVVCALRADQAADADAPRLAVCRVGGVDIADWLVRTGYAFADRDHPEVYGEVEALARSQTTGIWRGPFVLPWDWRAGTREPAIHAEP